MYSLFLDGFLPALFPKPAPRFQPGLHNQEKGRQKEERVPDQGKR